MGTVGKVLQDQTLSICNTFKSPKKIALNSDFLTET